MPLHNIDPEEQTVAIAKFCASRKEVVLSPAVQPISLCQIRPLTCL